MFLREIAVLSLVAGVSAGAPIVNMQLLNSPGQPDIYDFLVNGTTVIQTLCDDATHSIITTPYQATENSLADLSGTLLNRDGNPNALMDYEEIAMLDLRALSDPTLVRDVTIAEWAITQGRDARDPGAAAMLSWVSTQDPTNFDLSNFVIFSTPMYQEQTGFTGGGGGGPGGSPIPEPRTFVLTGLAILLLFHRRLFARARG